MKPKTMRKLAELLLSGVAGVPGFAGNGAAVKINGSYSDFVAICDAIYLLDHAAQTEAGMRSLSH